MPAVLVLTSICGCGGGSGQPESQPPAQPAPEAAALPEPEIVENLVFLEMTEEPEKIRSGWISAICLNVRSSAGTSSEVLGHVVKGDRVDILEEQQVSGYTWYRIDDEAGYVHGWVSSGYVSGTPVSSGAAIPSDYKEPRTPTIVDGVAARYLGNRACKRCHSQSHGEFAQGEYGVWVGHYHADAYRTLGRSYTIALARKRGIEDPQSDWRCVKCHVTAYGAGSARLGPNYNELEGVGCEACHGPGEDYLEPHQDGSASDEELAAMGFRVFRDLAARDQLCRACHNELSPTYKQFNVEAFSAEIRHWEERFTQTIRESATPAMQATSAPKKIDVAERQRQLDELEKIRELAKEIDATAVKAKPKLPPARPATPPAPPPPPPTRPATPPPSQPTKPATPPPPPPSQPTKPATPPPSKPGDRLAGAKKELMLDIGGKKGQVFFPHHDHLDYVDVETEADNCQVCHHTTEPPAIPSTCGACHGTTDAPSRKDAFHDNCKNCHREAGGPTKCTACHNP